MVPSDTISRLRYAVLVQMLLVILGFVLVGVLATALVGALVVASNALERLTYKPMLQPGQTVVIEAMGQIRECIVVSVAPDGTALVRPITGNLTP